MGCGASTGHYSELAYEKFKHDAEDGKSFFGAAVCVVLEGVIIAHNWGPMKWLGNFRLEKNLWRSRIIQASFNQ